MYARKSYVSWFLYFLRPTISFVNFVRGKGLTLRHVHMKWAVICVRKFFDIMGMVVKMVDFGHGTAVGFLLSHDFVLMSIATPVGGYSVYSSTSRFSVRLKHMRSGR